MRSLKLAVPADEFVLGRVLDLPPGGYAVVERVVPTGRHFVPLVSVHGVSPDRVRDGLRSNPAVEEASVVESAGDRVTVRTVWRPDADPLFRSLAGDGLVLSVRGDDETWIVEVAFEDDVALAAFRARCEERGIAAVPRDLSESLAPRPRDVMTEKQYETLRLALQHGYFDVPRGAGLDEIGDRLGVTSQAASERLRRALRAILRFALPGHTHRRLAAPPADE